MTKRITLLSLVTLLTLSQGAYAQTAETVGSCPAGDSITQDGMTFKTFPFSGAAIFPYKTGFGVHCFYGTGDQMSLLSTESLPDKYNNTDYTCLLVKGTKGGSKCNATSPKDCPIKCKPKK